MKANTKRKEREEKGQRYSTIDQHLDGKTHPALRPGVGPFHNKTLPPVELTDFAKKVIEQEQKKNGG